MPYNKVVISKNGGPEVLQVVREEQLPEPGPGEVRIRVLTTSAAFTDTIIRRGIYPATRKKGLPFAPGYDMVVLSTSWVLAFRGSQAVMS